MTISLPSAGRAVAAAALVTVFAAGCGRGGTAASSPAGQSGAGPRQAALAASSATGRITVTGTGTVTGTPGQLVLAMGVQTNGPSPGSALASASAAVTRVTSALRASGVAASDIQTSGLSLWPDYPGGSQVPSGYQVSESLTATLDRIPAAGGQIDAAVRAGGNAATISGISLNLTDTSSLLARARARAVADATAKARQYAAALGQPLGPVVSVSDQAPSLPLPLSGAPSGASARATVPISPGSQQLTVTITAVFAI